MKYVGVWLILILILWVHDSQSQTYNVVDSILEEYADINLSFETDEEREAPLVSL